MQVHKQLACLGKRVCQHAHEVLMTLCKALGAHGMTDKAASRAAAVLKRILTGALSREVLTGRHLHQVIMCVVFGVCKVEEVHGATFRTIIGEHQTLYDEPESLYWMVFIGPAADQTGKLTASTYCLK
ncbi:hypothetical protein T484DRAFT_1855909 [Baffinella frigidus]|nr:hypothetical protein T484DRAFT_1855909 [Cryptophyta sp. CCMP2293]